jgi:hypothetical protein
MEPIMVSSAVLLNYIPSHTTPSLMVTFLLAETSRKSNGRPPELKNKTQGSGGSVLILIISLPAQIMKRVEAL